MYQIPTYLMLAPQLLLGLTLRLPGQTLRLLGQTLRLPGQTSQRLPGLTSQRLLGLKISSFGAQGAKGPSGGPKYPLGGLRGSQKTLFGDP